MMQQCITLEVEEGSEDRRLYEREFSCRVVPELAKPQQSSREQRGGSPIHHPPHCSGTFLLGHGQLLMPNSGSKQKDFETPESTMCILLHAIATRISTSLSQFHISVPFLLHSARCPFASCCTYLQCLFCHTACSLPCSVSFPSLLMPLPRFQFGVTFSQIFPGCHQGQRTANRVTSCLRNEEKPLLSHPSSTLCKASSTSKTAGQRE